MANKSGILYGLGVGPGDPELITLKAARILNSADVVYAAASSKNSYSLAVNIARPHIPDLTPIKQLSFPMTKDQMVMAAAWRNNARILIEQLEEGKIVAFLTLGDSMTYSTYGYLLRYINHLAPHIPVISVPGITAYQAAAACLNEPLVEGEEALLILSGVKGGDCIRKYPQKPENIVFMKAYRNINDISAALEESGLLEKSRAVQNCGLPDQTIVNDIGTLKQMPPNYWTLILTKQHEHDVPEED
jgi:precorrin-2/cobalt-factor-2 C20-methyltransferase